jgi:hypothetical protein
MIGLLFVLHPSTGRSLRKWAEALGSVTSMGVSAKWAEVHSRSIPSTAMGQDIIAVIETIRERHLPDYRLWGDLARDAAREQRVHEGAWPIRELPTSHYVVGFRRDLLWFGSACQPLTHESGAVIAYCRN